MERTKDEIEDQIKQIIYEMIRPAIQQDNGDILFEGYDNGVVTVQLIGACDGCPSSTITLKMGIENTLKHFVPEVTEVVSI